MSNLEVIPGVRQRHDGSFYQYAYSYDAAGNRKVQEVPAQLVYSPKDQPEYQLVTTKSHCRTNSDGSPLEYQTMPIFLSGTL